MNTIIIIFMNTIKRNFEQGWEYRRPWQVERKAIEQIQHLLLQKVKMVITDDDEDGDGDDSYSGALESVTTWKLESAKQPRRRRRGRV